MELQGSIYSFAERYGLGRKTAYRLQLCTEELICEMLAHCEDEVDLDLSIEYSEAEKRIRLCCKSAGRKYNPFAGDADSDPLGIVIIKRTAAAHFHCYDDGRNVIMIEM